LRLQEVGNFGDEKFLPPLNLIHSTKLHLSTEPAFLPNACSSEIPLSSNQLTNRGIHFCPSTKDPEKINVPTSIANLCRFGSSQVICPKCKKGKLILASVVLPNSRDGPSKAIEKQGFGVLN
jgi:hypothetical protein